MTSSAPLIVIADTKDANIRYYTEVAESCGAQCVATTLGGNLQDLVANKKPALVILDSRLEDPDGYQCLNLLKSNESTRHIPVLFMVGNLSERKMSLHEDLFKLVRVMSKPLQESVLRSTIEDYLRLEHYHSAVEALTQKSESDLVNGLQEGILAVDTQGRIVFANYAAELLLRANVLDLVGTYLESLFEEACLLVDSKWQEHPISKVTSGDQILQVDKAVLWRKDGDTITAKFAAVPFKRKPDQPDHGIHLLFAFKQLKDTRESKDKLAKLAQVDHLTKLPLRAALEEQIDRCAVKAALSGFYFAVLSVDLDHFRYINESLGHDLGDCLIKAVAERIQKLLRRDDVIARMEGDEFVVVLSHIDLLANAGMVAKKIIESVREPFLIDGHEVFTGCSVGVAVYPACGDNAKSLLKNSQSALARAKAIRSSCQYYTAEMNKARSQQVQFEFELHQAVEQKQWRIQYQPVVAASSNEVVACEIKLTWLHPTQGELSLESFLTEAEEAGLSSEIFRWLWQQALQRFQRLSDEAKEKVRLIVPVSPSVLLQDGGVEWAQRNIERVGLKPEQVYVELPESYYTLRHSDHGQVLNHLRKVGFHLILDGFGTGFAPMNLLKEIPYSLIRLSSSFVATCELSKTDQAIIKGTIAMVHELGIQVMAAGVDSEKQLAFLQREQCDWFSGEAVAKALEQSPQKLDAMGIFVSPG